VRLEDEKRALGEDIKEGFVTATMTSAH